MFGLFDWIWDLLYAVSKSMYQIIDNLLSCANMLCGIEPIVYSGTEMDFLTFLMRNPTITYAFVGATLVSVVLVFIFAIIAIIRTTMSEKLEKTPAQIAVDVGKTLLMFLFIPAAMTLLILFTNQIMRVLYETTLGGSPDGLGRFLAGTFGQGARKGGVDENFYLLSEFKYTSTSNVKGFLDLSDYDYFFSWISSIVIIIALGSALLMFVDRAISIVILFIFSPISMSTTVLDGGVRFKLWRDQFITKFLTGYGCILAINIYALIVVAITNSNLVFFNNSILNFFMKVVIVVGGGVSMMRIMALIGNLINSGAGSNELRDAAFTSGMFRRAMVGGALAPFRATRSAIDYIKSHTKGSGGGGAGGQKGRSSSAPRSLDELGKQRQQERAAMGSGSGNNKTGSIQSGNNAVKNAINGGGNALGIGGGKVDGGNNINILGDSGNSMKKSGGDNPGGNMVSNAINNSLNKGDDNK